MIQATSRSRSLCGGRPHGLAGFGVVPFPGEPFFFFVRAQIIHIGGINISDFLNSFYARVVGDDDSTEERTDEGDSCTDDVAG